MPPLAAQSVRAAVFFGAAMLSFLPFCACDKAPPPITSTWQPPPNPDPAAILNQARADAEAGRYADALAKHLWYHNHALEHDPAQLGVRLSFAINYWTELGHKYRPALRKLREIRDESERRLRTDATDIDLFRDIEAINDQLEETERTVELFRWLDEHRPQLAKNCFATAAAVLVEAEEYTLCGKYLDPKADYDRIVGSYHRTLELARRSQLGYRLREQAQTTFSRDITRLVALLVRNGRQNEADQIATEAAQVWKDTTFAKQLNQARQGKFP